MTEMSFSLIGVSSPSVGALARLARSVSGSIAVPTFPYSLLGNEPDEAISRSRCSAGADVRGGATKPTFASDWDGRV